MWVYEECPGDIKFKGKKLSWPYACYQEFTSKLSYLPTYLPKGSDANKYLDCLANRNLYPIMSTIAQDIPFHLILKRWRWVWYPDPVAITPLYFLFSYNLAPDRVWYGLPIMVKEEEPVPERVSLFGSEYLNSLYAKRRRKYSYTFSLNGFLGKKDEEEDYIPLPAASKCRAGSRVLGDEHATWTCSNGRKAYFMSTSWLEYAHEYITTEEGFFAQTGSYSRTQTINKYSRRGTSWTLKGCDGQVTSGTDYTKYTKQEVATEYKYEMATQMIIDPETPPNYILIDPESPPAFNPYQTNITESGLDILPDAIGQAFWQSLGSPI